MLIETLNFIISFILVFLNFLMFHSLRKKKNRSKEENIILEKTFLTGICFLYYLCLILTIIIEIFKNERKNIFYQIQEYIFNVYIFVIYLMHCFISLEMFYTYKSPIYYFLYIFGQKSRKIYEFILFLSIISITAFNYYDPLKEKPKEEDFFDTPFILLDKYKCFILLLMSSLTIVFNIKLYLLISKFYFNKNYKLKKIILKRLFANIFYLIYGLYYGIYYILISKYFNIKISFLNDNYEIPVTISSCIILVSLFLDTIVELSILSSSKFALYKLGNSIINICGCIFSNDYGELLNESNLEETLRISDLDFDTTNEDESSTEENEISLIAKSPEDNDLISIFKNNIFFDDYYLNFLDQYFNILMATLFKMYNSKLFSTASVNNQKLKEELNISCSGIGVNNASNTNDFYANVNIVSIKENSSTFNFCTDEVKNPFNLFKSVLGPKLNDINVQISTYFTNQCVYNIINSNLLSKKIGTSLVCHFLINSKKEKQENMNNFMSLITSNAKEESFKNIKNISLKSYDKYFNLDIFETNDDEINQNSKSNKDIAKMIIEYFNYIQNGKGQTGSFLPTLIGIFKIKINNFKSNLIFVSRNTLVQNIPKNFYTYWQLLRFDRKRPEKIASSKLNRRTIVKDDPLFERPFSTGPKKDYLYINKILLKNYADFKEIIFNDIKFLKDNNLSYVNLLMMYYEYENTQKHEKGGAIKIRKTTADQVEIINVDIPQKSINEDEDEDEEFLAKSSNANINAINSKQSNEQLLNVLSDNVEDIFGDEKFDFTPDSGKIANNLMDYSEKVNINGYDGNFDNYNCLCFFTFENVFDVRKKFNFTTQPYTLFEKKILENFSQFNKKN